MKYAVLLSLCLMLCSGASALTIQVKLEAPPKDEQEEVSMFEYYDTNKDGCLNGDEITKMSGSPFSLVRSEYDSIWADCFTLEDFVAAENFFKTFDINSDNQLTPDEAAKKSEILSIVVEHEDGGDGVYCFKDFLVSLDRYPSLAKLYN